MSALKLSMPKLRECMWRMMQDWTYWEMELGQSIRVSVPSVVYDVVRLVSRKQPVEDGGAS